MIELLNRDVDDHRQAARTIQNNSQSKSMVMSILSHQSPTNGEVYMQATKKKRKRLSYHQPANYFYTTTENPQYSLGLGWPAYPALMQPSLQATAHSSLVAPLMVMHWLFKQLQKQSSAWVDGPTVAAITMATRSSASIALLPKAAIRINLHLLSCDMIYIYI